MMLKLLPQLDVWECLNLEIPRNIWRKCHSNPCKSLAMSSCTGGCWDMSCKNIYNLWRNWLLILSILYKSYEVEVIAKGEDLRQDFLWHLHNPKYQTCEHSSCHLSESSRLLGWLGSKIFISVSRNSNKRSQNQIYEGIYPHMRCLNLASTYITLNWSIDCLADVCYKFSNGCYGKPSE